MRVRHLLLLAILTLTLQACNDISVSYSDDNQPLPPKPTGGLVARVNSPIADVPMPMGFVMLESRSRSYATAGGGRYIEHYYQSLASKADTLAFYRRTLAQNNWELRTDQNQGGNIALAYVKGHEVLNLDITNPAEITTVKIVVRAQGAPLPGRPVAP